MAERAVGLGEADVVLLLGAVRVELGEDLGAMPELADGVDVYGRSGDSVTSHH